jgi:hypothetical protein
VLLTPSDPLPERIVVGRCGGDKACSAENCYREHIFTLNPEMDCPTSVAMVGYTQLEVHDVISHAVYEYAPAQPAWLPESRERELLTA